MSQGRKCEPGCECYRHTGHPHSPESLEKMHTSWTEERRVKQAARTREQNARLGAGQRLGLSNRGRKHPADCSHCATASAWTKEHHTGSKRSAEARARMSAAAKAGFRDGRRTVAKKFTGTQPEQLMAALLEHAGVKFEGQKRVGGRQVDFYLPESRAVIEVDGVYWHPDGPDIERDEEILAAGVSFVHHVSDMQLIGAL